MNKRGQFYVLTTIIILTVVAGAVSVFNYSKTPDLEFSSVEEELKIESEKVMDYALKNDLNMTQVLTNFTNDYIEYAKPGQFYFVFGNSSTISLAGYQTTNEDVSVNTNGSSQELTFSEKEYKRYEFSSGGNFLNVTINGVEYDVKLSGGQNFHFIILKDVEEERYVVTDHGYGASVSDGDSGSGSESSGETLTISSNTTNYNIFSALGSPSEAVEVTLTINSGVVVGGTSTSEVALTTGNLNSSSSVTIVNNGYIVGRGGDGGNYPGGKVAGLPGENGGTALNVTISTTIENNGIIGGGAGGGGAGGGSNCGECYDDPGAGGGGGAGFNPGAGGNSSRTGTFEGSDGSLISGGAGGTVSNHGSQEFNQAGDGGDGGGLGENGESGENGSTYSGGAGGEAGAAVVGSSLVTWTTQGDVRGALN